jgi:hypothetical protein
VEKRRRRFGCLHFLCEKIGRILFRFSAWGSVRKQLQIAGVTLSVNSKDLKWQLEDDSHYSPFVVAGQDTDIVVDVRWHPLGVRDLGMEVFSARDNPGRFPPNWRLYHTAHGLWHLQVNASAYPVFVERMAVFESHFRQGTVYVELAHRELAVYPFPLSAPLDRVLFVNIVTHGLGVMLHACGVVLDGKGYLFAGPSNAGKTTLARLWAEFGDATVLGDECLILRRKGDRFWVYGTPWVGEAGLFSPEGVPVEGIFHIRHAAGNTLARTPIKQAVEQLLGQTILTPYDPFAVEYGLDFCLDFVHEVPAHDLGFVPDESAVEMIRGELGRA